MQFPRNLTTACIALLSILSLALPQLTVASVPFAQNLQLRDTGDDVARLQQFLNEHNYLIAQSGPGSPGNETTTFGLLTYQALTLFQSAHGLPATGFFGPLTRAGMATLAASSTATSTPPSSVGTSTAAVPQLPAVLPFSPLSSTTSGYIPGVTPLPGYKPGQIIFIGGGAPTPATSPASPPSPAPYVAKAVHFEPGTQLHMDSLTASNSSRVLWSLWIEVPVTPVNYVNLPDIDQANASLGPYVDHPFGEGAKFRTGWTDQGFNDYIYHEADGVLNQWVRLMGTVDTNFPAGSRIDTVYMNDQLLSTTLIADSCPSRPS